MHVYIKYGVSVVALLAALSLAQAQNERQGGGGREGGAAGHSQPERGKEGGSMERAPSAQEHGKGESRTAPAKEKQPAALREGEHGAREPAKGETRASTERENRAAEPREGEHGAREPAKGETRASTERENRAAEPREGERKAQRTDENRQSNTAGAVRKPNIHISRVQKTRLHDALGASRTIRRYRAAEIHFAVEVGTRIPESVVFYDAPVEFIDVASEFSGYKIVVLDNEILVIDPETREIVEIIPI
jgi:hypothetical protein